MNNILFNAPINHGNLVGISKNNLPWQRPLWPLLVWGNQLAKINRIRVRWKNYKLPIWHQRAPQKVVINNSMRMIKQYSQNKKIIEYGLTQIQEYRCKDWDAQFDYLIYNLSWFRTTLIMLLAAHTALIINCVGNSVQRLMHRVHTN